MPIDESFLTVAEVAKLLKINQQTIRNWIFSTVCGARPCSFGLC